MDDETAEAWARAELCRQALCAVAGELQSIGVGLVAFKGVHIAFCVAPHPRFRSMTDADAIVTGDFDASLALLRRRHRVIVNDWSAATVIDDQRNVAVDLHRTPLPPFFGAFDLRAMRSRAETAAAFSHGITVPDPVDATVIALAHHVKDKLRHATLRDARMLRDRAGVTADALAARARSHGLRRVTLLALTDLSSHDTAFESWIEALAPSSSERRWAREVVRVLRGGPSKTVAFALSRGIGDDAVAIARSLLLGALTRLPYLVRSGLRAT